MQGGGSVRARVQRWLKIEYASRKRKKQWHTTKRPLTESTVGSGVEVNSMTRVAETTELAHGARETATDKSG